MAYPLIGWLNDQAPSINQTNLNHMDNGILGAHDEITKTQNELIKNEKYTGTKYSILETGTPGAIDYNDGSIITISAVTSVYKYTDFIKVTKDAIIDYTLRATTGSAMIAFYATDNISSYNKNYSVVGNGGALSGQYVVPDDGYVILTMRNDLATIKSDYKIVGKIDAIEQDIDDIDVSLAEIPKIQKELNDLEKYTGDKYSILDSGTPGAVSYDDGSIITISAVTSSYKYTNFIPVKTGDKIDYELRATTNTAMIAFYNSKSLSSYVKSKSLAGNGGGLSGTYNVTADGFVILTMRNDLETIKANYLIDGKINDIEQDIDEINETLESYVGTKPAITELQHGAYSLNGADANNGFLNAGGAFIANAVYRTTDYFKVNNGDSIKYRIGHATALPIICFYTDKSESSAVTNKFVTGINGYSEGNYAVTQDGYVRFCYYYTRNEGYAVFDENVPDNVKLYAMQDTIGGKNILCLGDSIFGNDGEIVQNINLLSGATALNCAFGGTQVAIRSGNDNFKYFDGENLVHALCTQTWTDQDAAAEALSESYPWVTDRLAALKAVDMSKIDLITMDWGTNDYTNGKTIEEITSAYNAVIDDLQHYFPAIRLLIITPTWRYFSSTENGDNKVYNVSTLKEIAQAIFENAHDKRIETIQMYQNMPLSYNTASTYFDSGQGVHLNSAGNLVYAHILLGRMRAMY